MAALDALKSRLKKLRDSTTLDERAIGGLQKLTRGFESGVSKVSNVGNQLPTTQFVKVMGQNLAKDITTAGNSARQFTEQVKLNRQYNRPTFENTGSIARQGAVPAARSLAFPVTATNPGMFLTSAALGGAINKAGGGSFTQGASQGGYESGLTSALLAATNPIARRVLTKVPVKAPQVIQNRIAPAATNVIQGVGMNIASGSQVTPLSIGIDAVSGLAGGKNQFGAIGKGIQGRPNMHPQDASAVDAVIDTLRNKKASQDDKKAALVTLDRLAGKYLSKTEIDRLRGSQKSLNAKDLRIARELQSKAGSAFDMGGYQLGITGKNPQPTKGLEVPQVSRRQLTGKQLGMTNEQLAYLEATGRQPKPGSQPKFNPEITQDIRNIERAVDSKVNLLDYFRTPDRVLKKIGLEKEATLIKQQYNKYLDELPKEIDKVTQWSSRVNNSPEASRRIFRYLDGKNQPLAGEELVVASEIKSYLSNWADKLGLPKEGRLANYITHIFEKDFIEKEFDPDLAKIIQDRIPGSVYDPFLEKRLGQKGYIEDVFSALDAYVKRATRKVNMDVALEQLQKKENTLDLDSWNYVKNYTDRINLRPTDIDNLLDNAIKQSPIGYRLGQRPVATISRNVRQMIYRGTLGLNVGSAIRNLTQVSNTYAKLGEKRTAQGLMKTLRAIASGDDELERVGVLRNNIIEDRTLSATKKFWENLDKGLFYFFEKAEKINRGTAYYGAKAKALADGKTEQQAIQEGLEMARKTQFTFGSVDTPVALQSDLVKLATQFQSYNVKQTEFLTEMARNKEYAGMLRWAIANMVILSTVGQAMGWDYKDMIPFSGVAEGESPIGNTPFFKLTSDVVKMAVGAEDKYGNKIGVDQIGKDIVPFFPSGSQIKKSVEGIAAGNRGYSESNAGLARFPVSQDTASRIKLAILGQYSDKNARKYFNEDRKPLGEKQTQALASLQPENRQAYYDSIIAGRKSGSDAQSGQNIITNLFSQKSQQAQASEPMQLPTTQADFDEVYKQALSKGRGFQDEARKIQFDPTLTPEEKQQKLQEKRDAMTPWAEMLIRMQDEKPEMVFEAEVKTYGKGSSEGVENRAAWAVEKINGLEGKELQNMLNRLWDEGVLTGKSNGVAQFIQDEYGINVWRYTGSDKTKGKSTKGKKATIKATPKIDLPAFRLSPISISKKSASLPGIRLSLPKETPKTNSGSLVRLSQGKPKQLTFNKIRVTG